jgi:hypothetical protein
MVLIIVAALAAPGLQQSSIKESRDVASACAEGAQVLHLLLQYTAAMMHRLQLACFFLLM